MSSVFRFKRFEVDQGRCAMKINTDGVLLGASAHQPGANRILDIGTGTGVIALMAAQLHPEAYVDALDIDEEAYRQAALNFGNSEFGERMSAYLTSFEFFDPAEAYDLILANPPFYTDSLRNPDQRKSLAKHSDVTFFEKLIDFVALHLSANGKFQCVLPTELADWLIKELLPAHQLHCSKELSISSFVHSDVIRKILTISRNNQQVERANLAIYNENNVHSQAYKDHLKAFFLAF